MSYKPISRLTAFVALAIVLAGCAGNHHPPQSAATVRPNTTLRFMVAGMHCEGCSGGIRSELLAASGVAKASVNHKTGLAVVRCDTNATSSDALVKVIEEAGFKARPISR